MFSKTPSKHRVCDYGFPTGESRYDADVLSLGRISCCCSDYSSLVRWNSSLYEQQKVASHLLDSHTTHTMEQISVFSHLHMHVFSSVAGNGSTRKKPTQKINPEPPGMMLIYEPVKWRTSRIFRWEPIRYRPHLVASFYDLVISCFPVVSCFFPARVLIFCNNFWHSRKTEYRITYFVVLDMKSRN